MDEIEIQVVKVPMLDTGLGREAGYKDDKELIKVARVQREELAKLLTPEGLKLLEDAERESVRFILGP